MLAVSRVIPKKEREVEASGIPRLSHMYIVA